MQEVISESADTDSGDADPSSADAVKAVPNVKAVPSLKPPSRNPNISLTTQQRKNLAKRTKKKEGRSA